MKDRVKKIQEHFKLTQKQFANELCVAEATISSIYKGRTAPSTNFINAIHQAYPGINMEWLIFDEGEMFKPLVGSGASNSGQNETDASLFSNDSQGNSTVDDLVSTGAFLLGSEGMLMGTGVDVLFPGAASANSGAASANSGSAPANSGAALVNSRVAQVRSGAGQIGSSAAQGTNRRGSAGIGQNVGYQNAGDPSLFDGQRGARNGVSIPTSTAGHAALSDFSLAEVVSELKKANTIDKPVRKIKEIRVFYDDGTFEAFIPSSK